MRSDLNNDTICCLNMCKTKPRQSLLWIQSKWQCSESCSNIPE
jgi:hypothetical protein